MTNVPAKEGLRLSVDARNQLWAQTFEAIETYYKELPGIEVAPRCSPGEVRSWASSFDFEQPRDIPSILENVVVGLRRYALHTSHPRSFGLFNPTPSALGVAADALVAGFNPQLAAWSHAPYAVELEQHLLKSFGAKLGMDYAALDGTFTSGGAEANHTAILTALANAFPESGERGLRALPAAPRIYVSAESHHSFIKAARACGLGTDSVVRIPVDDQLRMEPALLEHAISQDLERGDQPLMLVATVGTTSAGAIDDVAALYLIARKHKIWLHVDAAYGGCAALLPELSSVLGPVHKADSITLDAHKGLSVPMAAGMFLTRHQGVLDKAFAITTDYVPARESDQTIDPYAHSMQWSRRFIGLKLFMTLASVGWHGYAEVIRNQVRLGRRLRELLSISGWQVVHPTELPVVCFVDEGGLDAAAIVSDVVGAGNVWLSTTKVGSGGRMVLRACVTSYLSSESDIQALVDELNRSRVRLQAANRAMGSNR